MAVEEYVDLFIVDATPALFAGDRFNYHTWRSSIAPLMDVDPASLHVVGSSCLGFSLNPDHMWREFRPRSDIDVAVISSYHFDVAWRFIRRPPRLRWPSKVRYAIRNHAAGDVFRGCIATDKILGVLPFAEEWLEAKRVASEHPSVGGRTVNFRLYRDVSDLRDYQKHSVRKARDLIDEDRDD